MNLDEMNDFATAHRIIRMRIDERTQLGEYDYFDKFYNMDLDELAAYFTACINSDLTMRSAFEAFCIAYELGRNEQVMADTPTIEE